MRGINTFALAASMMMLGADRTLFGNMNSPISRMRSIGMRSKPKYGPNPNLNAKGEYVTTKRMKLTGEETNMLNILRDTKAKRIYVRQLKQKYGMI